MSKMQQVIHSCNTNPFYWISATECSGMNAEKKDVMAYASLLHSNVCDGVVVKLLTTQSTEKVLYSNWTVTLRAESAMLYFEKQQCCYSFSINLVNIFNTHWMSHFPLFSKYIKIRLKTCHPVWFANTLTGY